VAHILLLIMVAERRSAKQFEAAMIALKNILVATDFSDPSKVALDYGRDLARSYGATLHVLHIVQDLSYQYGGEVGFPLPDLQAQWVAESRKRLEALITDDDRRGMQVVPTVQTMVSPAAGIVEYAKDHAIDLIITGTHGRAAVQHIFMGSVAERVVRTAPCPVLTVRSPERDFLAADALTVTAAAQ
jgi:nucleotide-binding universal stress UspA family protein